MSLRVVRGWVIALTVFAAAAVTTTRAFAAAAPAPPAKPGDSYTIRLHRPMRVGDKYAYSADATFVQTLTANLSGGQTRTLQPRSLSVHFEGTEEILAVDGRGRPTQASYTVAECTAREGKQQTIVVQPGRVVTVEAGKWKSSMDVDQGAFTIQDDFLAHMVLGLPNTGQPTDDEVFGAADAQKLGSTWPLRPDPLVQSFASATGMKLKKQNISGTMKLAGLDTIDGVACYKVQGKAMLAHFLPPATDLPSGARIEDATFEYKFTKVLPADQTGQCTSDSYSTKVLLKLRSDEAGLGPDIVVDGKLLRTVGIKRKPVRE